MTRMLWILAVTALSTSLGCQALGDFSTYVDEKAAVGKPTEIGAIWQDGVSIQLDANHGGLPIPGFAGRVFFMQSKGAGNGKPAPTVLVDGTLLIQLFDDRQQGPPVPLETWTILPEHLPLLVKKDICGWGYSIWLPWNTFNQSIRQIRMTVQYQGKDGTRLLGEPSPIQIQGSRQGGLPTPQLDVKYDKKKIGQ